MKANVNLMYKNTAQTSENIHKTTKKRVKTRRFLSLFLTLSIVASFFVLPEMSASAAEPWAGSGSQASPYLIRTATDLKNLSLRVGGGNDYNGVHFRQTTDITTDSNFIPIGSTGGNFAGDYDGQMYNIYHTASYSNKTHVGVFGYTTNATIRNVIVRGTLTTTDCSSVGSVVGCGYNTTIENCTSYATINATRGYSIGGIAGSLGQSSIKYGLNEGSITYFNETSRDIDMGGIVGNSYRSTLEYVRNKGSLAAYANKNLIGSSNFCGRCVGGLAGTLEEYSSIKYGSNSGNVYAASDAGGLFGDCAGTSISVSESYNTAGISAGSRSGRIGGLAGTIGEGGSVSNCYNMGVASAYDGSAGLVGYLRYGGKISSCLTTKPGSGYNSDALIGVIESGVYRYDMQYLYCEGSGSYSGAAVGGSNVGYASFYQTLPPGFSGGTWKATADKPELANNGVRDYESSLYRAGSAHSTVKATGSDVSLVARYGQYKEYELDYFSTSVGDGATESELGTYAVYEYLKVPASHISGGVYQWQMPKRIGFTTINKGDVPSPTINSSTLTYNGSSQYLTTAPATSSTSSYKRYFYVSGSSTTPSSTASGWTTDRPAKTDAGTYYIWTKAAGSAYYNDLPVTYIGVKSIGKRTPTASANINSSTLTYSGSAQQLLGTASTNGGTLKYYCSTSDTTPLASATSGWSTTKPTATAAGTYYLWYQVVGDGNNYGIGVKYIGSKSIVKATSTKSVSINSTALTYNGKAQSLTGSVSGAGGTIYYNTSTSSTVPTASASGWTTTAPTQTNAGTYYVFAKVVGDSNYNAKVPWLVGSKIIAKRNNTITVASDAISRMLAGTEQANTFSLGVTVSNNLTPTYKSSAPTVVRVNNDGTATALKPGQATITVSYAGDNNENAAESKEIYVDISGRAPGKVASFTAQSGQNGKITLNWTAPTFTGGSPITSYIIMRKAEGESAFTSISHTFTAIDTSYVDTDVVNGKTYEYQIRATSALGVSTEIADMATASAKPYTTSGPVRNARVNNDSAIFHHSQVIGMAIQWDAPENNGGDNPAYKVEIFKDEQCQTKVEDVNWGLGSDTTTETYIDALFNLNDKGKLYYAKITAVNGAGNSESVVVPVQLISDPDAPADFKTAPSNSSSIKVSWSEPEFTGYSKINTYTIFYRKHGSGEDFKEISLNGSELEACRVMVEENAEAIIGSKKYEYVIDGLETGVVYDVKMRDNINSHIYEYGYSEETKVLEQICAGTPLAPVIDGEMITKDSGVFVNGVTAEANGADITEYVFYARPTEDGEEAPFTEFARVNADKNGKLSNAYAKGNLANGKAYEICVAAVNIAGEGAKSEPQAINVGYPSVVQNVHITPQAGSIMNITFDPADGNGRKIDHYELLIGGTVNGKTQPVVTKTTKEISYDYFADERVNGDEVTVQVVAVTKISLTQEAKSAPSEKLTARIGAPSTPVLNKFETDETGVSLAWTDSAANGNAMKYYTVYIADISSADSTTITRFKTANADTESLQMVVAKGEIDTTDAVEAFDNSGQRVQLLTKYNYPFVDGHKYSVTVTATNAAGESDASNAGVFTFAAPAEPQDVVVTPEDGKLTVSWSKPLNDGGYKIVGYNIYLNEDKDPTMKVEWVKTINGVEAADDTEPAEGEVVKYQLKTTDYRKGADATSENYGDGQDNIDNFEVVIGDLANGYSYTATVKAINESGEGAGSNNAEPETPRTKASAPLNIEGQGVSGTSVDVSWRKPVSDGGTPINGYNVRAYAVSKKNMETGEYEDITPEVDEQGNKIAAAEMTNVIGTSCTVKGLKTEYGYVFEVCAVTSAGEGAIGTSNVAKTHTKPSKPSIVSLDSGVGSGATLPLTVTWAAPEDDGNSPIIGYDVLVGGFPMNKDGMLSPDELTWTFEDNRVKSGKTYKVTVRAYNAVDVEGVESDPMSIKVGTVPAPKNVQLSGDTDGNIYITWPIDQYKDVMSYIEKYVVYVDGEMFASTANNRDNQMTAELQDLGVKHKVEVAVLSTMGEGNKSVPVYITLGTTDSINNVSAVAGKESIKLTWDKPTVHTNNLNPSSYTVYANGKAVKTISTADLDIVNNKIKTELTDLEGGKEYTITVTATNKYGECEPSEAVKATPWSDPDTPKVSNIKPALGEFSFTFEDGNGNGAAIADHNIYLDGNKLEASAYTIDGNKVTVKNVTDGGEGHKFYITAVTVVGGGTCESAKPDPEYTVITGVPLVPGNVKAIAGVSEATIAFDKSEDISAEYPVTKYNIYKIENGVETLLASVPSRDENGNVAERYSYTVKELTNGTDYSFAVSALNDLGESEHCGVSVKPGTPTAPEIESVTPSSGKLEIKWTEPESSNAGAITKYGVYLNGVLAKTTPETSLLIKELENGSEYVITVSAFNYVGEGEKSEPVTATPGGPPDKVHDISYELTYNDTDKCGVELTWRAPEDTGGLEVIGYKVIGEGNIVITGRTAVITGLERGTDYTWDIIACSAAGDGNAVTTETIKTLDKPGAPKLVGVDSSNVEFTITWKAPTNDGNSNITAYNFYFKPVDGGKELAWTPDSIPEADLKGEMSVSVNTDMLEELAVGQKYEISITAVNAVDESERSESTRTTLNDALEQKKPGAPTNIKASKGDTKITVSWAAPFSDGNSTITSYVIWTGTSEDNMGYLATVDGYTFSYEHTGLQNGTKRFYKVKAVNGVDADGGPFSEIVSETPVKINAPTKPAWVTFNDAEGKSAYETSASGDTMTFRWNESTGDELGGEISYEVYINGTLMDTTDGLEYVLSNPANNTRYNVQIKAVNTVGGETLSDYLYAYKNLNIRKGKAEEGYEYDEYYNDNVFAYIDADYDGEEDYKPTYTKPNPPENVELKQSKTEPSAILTWEPPVETGNKEINGYKAYITFNGETEIVQLDANGNVENGHSLFGADDISTHNDSLYEYVFGITYGKAYTVQMKAVNEIGESDPSSPATLYSFPETPSAFRATVEDKSNIALEWQLVSEPSSFTLYVNGKPQTEIAMNEVTATKDTASEFTTYKYTYPAELNETYFFEIVANFIGSDNNVVPSGRSDGCEISTKESQANAPTITSAKANGDAVNDMYRVTLEWTAPDNINDADVDADSYVVYVNGQEYTGRFYVDGAEVDMIPADATSVDIEDIYDKSLIKIAAVSASGTVGIVSEPLTFNAVEQTFEVGTPGKPEFTIDDCELVTENGVMLNEDNLIINWKSAAISDEHNVKATGFDIYFGSDYQDTVEADPNDTDDVQYSYTCTLTVEAGLDYNIRIVPIYAETEDADEIEGPEASVILEVPGYPEPSKPTLTAELSSDKKTIVLTWDANELSGVKYTVTVNSVDVAENIEGTSYTYTVEENVTDYVISVTAVRDYELSDGSIETTTAKSNSEKVTVQNGSGGGEPGDGNTNSNPPVITKTLSNGGVGGSGIKVKVYWNAPADKLQDEVGEIYKYVVVADDKAIGTVLVKNDDGTDNPLEYEITTFKTLTETKNVVIRAIKEINGQDVISATSKAWTVSPKYNVQNDPDKYEGDDSTGVTHPNTTGQDKEDEEKQQITLPILANVDGNVKVTITDNFDKTIEIGTELGEDGSGTVNINDADVNDPNKTFSITLSKECCTTYTITGLKYEDLTSSKLEELMNSVELYVGDFNGDGAVTNTDRAVLNRNMNKTGMTLADGDLNGDGVVTGTDRAMFNKAVNKVSIEIPFSK